MAMVDKHMTLAELREIARVKKQRQLCELGRVIHDLHGELGWRVAYNAAARRFSREPDQMARWYANHPRPK